MLIVGYCTGIRSERQLCEDVQLNPAYRWFCRLRLDGSVPDYFDVPEEPTRALSRERHASSHAADCFEHGKKDRCFFN
jgi:transposase